MGAPSCLSHRDHFSRFAFCGSASSLSSTARRIPSRSSPLPGGLGAVLTPMASAVGVFSSVTPLVDEIASIGDSAGRWLGKRELPAFPPNSPPKKGAAHDAMLSHSVLACSAEAHRHLTDRRRPATAEPSRRGLAGPQNAHSAFQNTTGSERIPSYTVPDARADSRERPATQSNAGYARGSFRAGPEDTGVTARRDGTVSPVMGSPRSCGGLAARSGHIPAVRSSASASPQERPWSPNMDPPPLSDEINPIYGNNPNTKDLT